MQYTRPQLYPCFPYHAADAVCMNGDAASGNACASGVESTSGCGQGAAASSQCVTGTAAGSDCRQGTGN